MSRQEIIEKLSKYFDIQELVCPHTYQKFSDKSWVQNAHSHDVG